MMFSIPTTHQNHKTPTSITSLTPVPSHTLPSLPHSHETFTNIDDPNHSKDSILDKINEQVGHNQGNVAEYYDVDKQKGMWGLPFLEFGKIWGGGPKIEPIRVKSGLF